MQADGGEEGRGRRYADAVLLRRLRQYAFRNLVVPEVAFGPGVTAIVGPNAAGKSNLLIACYLAASAELPAGPVRDALRFGESEGFVAAEIENRHGPVQVHVGLATGRKVLRIDGQAARAADVARIAAAVRITPEDAALIHGGPTGRRGWMDALLTRLSPRYGAVARAYGKVLEQRNAALRHGSDRATVAAFGDRLAELGDEVVDLRRRLIVRAGDLAADAYRDVAGPAKEFTIRYAPAQGERPLAEALVASEPEERARGLTVVGPHRDDLVADLDARSVQTYGSRGEARTAALALRVAEHRLLRDVHDEPPILLLDDFSAELDADRRAYLLDLAESVPQALVTGTEPPPRASRRLRIAGGELRDDG